jgi:hypothetical protein
VLFYKRKLYRLLTIKKILREDKSHGKPVKAPVAKPGYSSGLVYIESGKPQVAGSNPARGSKLEPIVPKNNHY